MLGERGLWFKMPFFEGSARVPLMISSSEMTSGVVDVPVSTINVCPTLCELAGVDMDEVAPCPAGEILVPLGQGAEHHTTVMMEYARV